MEEKKESQRIRMLELLTNEENNLMLYDALHDKDLTKFFYLLKQGYALTPFLLNCMIDYGYEKHIEKALCVCDRCSFAIYDFFCIYWGVDKTEDFFVKNSYTKVIQKRFSTKSLVKYQLWELLAERREYVVLAEHGQIELLKKLKQENPSDHLLGVREALRKVNAVEALAELKDWIGLAGLPEGELKLFELKEWRYVDFDKVSFLRKVPQEQLLQEVYEAGGGDFLFGQGVLLLPHGASFVILSCWHGSIISLLSAKNCGLNWPKPVLMKRLTGIVFINNALLKRTGNFALMRPKPAAGMFWPSIANAGFCSDADNSGGGLRALPEFVFS